MSYKDDEGKPAKAEINKDIYTDLVKVLKNLDSKVLEANDTVMDEIIDKINTNRNNPEAQITSDADKTKIKTFITEAFKATRENEQHSLLDQITSLTKSDAGDENSSFTKALTDLFGTDKSFDSDDIKGLSVDEFKTKLAEGDKLNDSI